MTTWEPDFLFTTQTARNAYCKSVRDKVWACTSEEDFDALEQDIANLKRTDEEMPHSHDFSYYEQILEDIENQKQTLKHINEKESEYDHMGR